MKEVHIMAHFLLVEDDLANCETWENWLAEEKHTSEKAYTYEEAVQKIWLSEQGDDKPFDIILLDHQLDGNFLGINVLEEISEEFGQDYPEDGFIVITAARDMQLVKSYSRWGALGYLLKPTNKYQLFATIINALERQYLYECRGDWKSIGELFTISQVAEELRNEQEELKKIHEELLELLESGNEFEIGTAFETARKKAKNATRTIKTIIPYLHPFWVTEPFLEDIKHTFHHERLKFHVLQSYLLKIANNPDAYHIKHLSRNASGHYEYRIGKTHRLYFRRQDGHIVLERFGHKSKQKEILHFLHKTGGGKADKIHEIASKLE